MILSAGGFFLCCITIILFIIVIFNITHKKTYIENWILVCVFGILTAIAIPLYDKYKTRTDPIYRSQKEEKFKQTELVKSKYRIRQLPIDAFVIYEIADLNNKIWLYYSCSTSNSITAVRMTQDEIAILSDNN